MKISLRLTLRLPLVPCVTIIVVGSNYIFNEERDSWTMVVVRVLPTFRAEVYAQGIRFFCLKKAAAFLSFLAMDFLRKRKWDRKGKNRLNPKPIFRRAWAGYNLLCPSFPLSLSLTLVQNSIDQEDSVRQFSFLDSEFDRGSQTRAFTHFKTERMGSVREKRGSRMSRMSLHGERGPFLDPFLSVNPCCCCCGAVSITNGIKTVATVSMVSQFGTILPQFMSLRTLCRVSCLSTSLQP